MTKHNGEMLNPGSGTIRGKNLKKHAIENISKFLNDVGGNWDWEYVKKLPCGRFLFKVHQLGSGTQQEIEMPGLPLDEVRYMKEPGQNIWDFDRLYVDGTSWVWKYAINALTGQLVPPRSI